MATDSEALMREGVAAAQTAFAAFLEEMDWQAGDIQKTFCHQVGRAHHRLLFESLGLDPRIDFSTFEYLGNTGSVALPMTAAIGIENGHVQPGDRVALLGIGSGINVIMLAWSGGSRRAEFIPLMRASIERNEFRSATAHFFARFVRLRGRQRRADADVACSGSYRPPFRRRPGGSCRRNRPASLAASS